MAKNKIITSQGNVQFINSKGRTINMHPMHCYAVYQDDTVSFLFIYMKEYSGRAFFSSQFEDLEVNGESYGSLDELKDAINYAFAKAGAQARTEIVTELPEDPFTNTIYLIKKEHGEGYDEYIWNEDEGWQLIGDTDIEFERYLKIDDFNPYSAATKEYIDSVSANTVQNASDIVFLSGAVDTEIAAREAADAVISGAVDTLSTNLSNEVQRAQNAETALGNRIDSANARIDAEQLARAQADTALGAKIDTLSGEVQTMGSEAVVDAAYVSSATTIEFYNASGTVVASIDASDFVKDGMIEDVRIENGYLIIDFNTESGIQDIQIPLTDIFDPDNYYDKTEIDGFVSNLEAADSVISGAVDTVSANLATETQRAQDAEDALSGAIDTKLAISDFNTYSGNVETELGAKANSADVYSKSEVYTKGEVDEAIAEIDLSDYYTTAQTDSKLALKADLSALTEDERVWGEALNDLNSRINTVSGDVANKVDTSVYNTYTANTQTAINAKANSADVYSKSQVYTKSEVDELIADIDLSEIENRITEDEEVTSAGLNALNDKFDGLRLKKISQSDYDALVQAGTVDANTLYIITD